MIPQKNFLTKGVGAHKSGLWTTVIAAAVFIAE